MQRDYEAGTIVGSTHIFASPGASQLTDVVRKGVNGAADEVLVEGAAGASPFASAAGKDPKDMQGLSMVAA